MNRKSRAAITGIFITIMSLLLLASPMMAWAGASVGIITDLKGSVTINGKNAELLQEVHINSVLAGKAGSKMTVSFLKDGHTESVSGNFKVKVANNALINAKGTKISKQDAIKKRTGGVTAIPITSSKPAAVRMRGLKALAVSPVPNDTVNTVNPTFRFVPGSEDLSKLNYLIITNTNDKSDVRVIEIMKKDRNLTNVDYPKDLPPLVNGSTYRWLVHERDKDDSMTNDNTFLMTVLSAETINALKTQEELAKKLVEKNPDDLSPYVSLISLYLSNKAFSKALEYARLIEQKRPKDNNILALIDTIYLNVYEKDIYFNLIKPKLQQIR
ncbi:MAG: tetratricopeptide repeat protein [Candidatus Xenobiia bacterium LiM19]